MSLQYFFLIFCIINRLTAQNFHAECEETFLEDVNCMVGYAILGNQSTVNIWADDVKFKGDNVKFSQIPSAIYEMSPQIKYLQFENVNLTTINVGDVKHLERLDIEGSSIEIIEDNVFVQSPEMKVLSLSHNKISEIEKDAFDGLTKLKNLDLSNNPITTIHEGTFERVPSLEYLTLAHSNIQVLTANLLSPLKSLMYLHLSFNAMTSFNATSVGVVSSLISLHLSGNRIKDLDVSNLSLLETLRMDQNNMTTLKSEMFHSDDRSKYFEFSKNQIKSVDPKFFEKNPNLSLKFTKNPCGTLTVEQSVDYDGLFDYDFRVRASNAAGNLKVCFPNY